MAFSKNKQLGSKKTSWVRKGNFSICTQKNSFFKLVIFEVIKFMSLAHVKAGFISNTTAANGLLQFLLETDDVTNVTSIYCTVYGNNT